MGGDIAVVGEIFGRELLEWKDLFFFFFYEESLTHRIVLVTGKQHDDICIHYKMITIGSCAILAALKLAMSYY